MTYKLIYETPRCHNKHYSKTSRMTPWCTIDELNWCHPMTPIKKDHTDFVQLTRGYLKDMRELSRRSPAAHQILWLLTERMNKTNAVVMSQATMASILGYSPSTIKRGVALLKNERWVQTVNIGTANGYIVNAKVLWRDHSGKRFASFFAEVVVSADEQNRPIEEWDNVELRQMPILRRTEEPLLDSAPLPPPDQQDLLPPDRIEFPHSRE